MKKEGYTYIEKLIERFFDGETTTAEEKELYAFFSGNEVPEEWSAYQGAFLFFEKELPEELEKRNVELIPATASRKKNYLRSAIASIALLIVLISGSIYYYTPYSNDRMESFVIINGEKITDPKIVEAGVNIALLEYILEEIEINNKLIHNTGFNNDEAWDVIEITYKK